MSEFKLIAIRPLQNCAKTIIKVLEEGIIYKFYNEFEFILVNENDKFSEVLGCKENKIAPTNIYTHTPPMVNICAIVGKNGSGKSSILDLLYAFYFTISLIEGKIDGIDAPSSKSPKSFRGKYIQARQAHIYKEINCEVYLKSKGKILRVVLNDGIIRHEQLQNKKWIEKRFSFSNFFYTIASNYSLYGLNNSDNPWIDYLFHKNDGYQIPVVINPYRENGLIDVNSELHLAQTRTLLNLSANNEKNPVIVNGKKVLGVRFVLDVLENDSIHIGGRVYRECRSIFKSHQRTHKQTIFDLFNMVSTKLAKFKLSSQDIKSLYPLYLADIEQEPENKYLTKNHKSRPSSLEIKYEFIKYVVRKVFKICIYYPNDYGSFLKSVNLGDPKRPIILGNLKELVNHLHTDKSHLTLKIRQALYTIRAKYFENSHWEWTFYKNDNTKYSYVLDMDWSDVHRAITNAEKEYKKFLDERMEIVPGAFVKPIIKVNAEKNKRLGHSYSVLSSGEQQLCSTLQTVKYHLYNLNSVHKSPNKKAKYKKINLIFDEIELYFHPEFQRKFILELLQVLSSTNLNSIEAINIIFSTHSPFILSDIPSCNVLKLDETGPKKYSKHEGTFASNIHDLLANEFFLAHGYMGAVAEEKVKQLTETLTYYSIKKALQKLSPLSDEYKTQSKELNKIITNTTILSKEEIKAFIEIIGEPLIKNSLNDMYFTVFSEDIDNEIRRLKVLQKKLQ